MYAVSFSLKAAFMVGCLLLLLSIIIWLFRGEKSRFREGRCSITATQLVSGRARTQVYVLMSPTPTPIPSFFSPFSPAWAPWMISWGLGAAPGRRGSGSVRSIHSHSARAASLLSVLPAGSLKKKEKFFFFLKIFCHKEFGKAPIWLGLSHFLKMFVIFFIS